MEQTKIYRIISKKKIKNICLQYQEKSTYGLDSKNTR